MLLTDKSVDKAGITKDPIEALWRFKTKYPYSHLLDYLEYLDANEAIQESVVEASKRKQESEAKRKQRG